MSSKSERIDNVTEGGGGEDIVREGSLISLTGSRLILAAFISFVIFSLLCLAENTNEEYFTRWYAKLEFQALSNNLVVDETGKLLLKHGSDISQYWSANADAYAFRIWDAAGNVIAASNEALFVGVSPVATTERIKPDRWQRKIGDAWFDTLSGRRMEMNHQPIWIEIATRGDPDKLRYFALYKDFIDDVVTPVVPTFVFTIGLALFSLRRALRPVQSASHAALALDPSASNTQLQIPTEGLPREVAVLAKAVNDLLERTETLMHSQNDFIGRAAHQLRTPLAVMLLQTEKIDDHQIGRLKDEIIQLGVTVDRLLELARMQGAPSVKRGQLDLFSLAEDVAFDLAAFAEQRGAHVRVVDLGAKPVCGDYVSMCEVMRNLVTNAVVHHPQQATVEVRCGPGPRFSVEDDGGGIAPQNVAALFEPFARMSTTCDGSGLGLAIVDKIIELHCGTISVSRSNLGGAAFCVDLVPVARDAVEPKATNENATPSTTYMLASE